LGPAPEDPPPITEKQPEGPPIWPAGEPLLSRVPLPWEVPPGFLEDLPPPKEEPTPPVKPPAPARARKPFAYRRLSEESEAELLRELASVPEVELFRTFPQAESRRLAARAARDFKAGTVADPMAQPELLKKPHLAGLPFRWAEQSRRPEAEALPLASASEQLRLALRATTPERADAPDPEALERHLLGAKRPGAWLRPGGHSALEQLLMGENEAVRLILTRLLTRVGGPAGAEALARRAVFDHSPRVREAALRGLTEHRQEDWLPTALAGLEHPWLPAARHAAEALASLDAYESAPTLQALLARPGPEAPFEKGGKGPHVREVVRVNRHRGCLLCHPPAHGPTDRVKAPCPTTDQPLQPFAAAGSGDGVEARGDVAYLRQDFSARLRVEKPGRWPQEQVFDFLSRERPAEARDLPRPDPPTPRQRVILAALRLLTDEKHGDDLAAWSRANLGLVLEARTVQAGLKSPRAVAVAEGVVHLAEADVVLRCEEGKRPVAWLRDPGGITSLADDGRGGLLATYGKARSLARLDPLRKAEKVIAHGPPRQRFAAPRQVSTDGKGGAYLCDGGDGGGAVYHVSAEGEVRQVKAGVSRPRGVAVSGKRLIVAGATELWAYDLEAEHLVTNGRRLARLEAAVGLAAVDGLACVLEDTGRSLDVYDSGGRRIARALLGDAPVACHASGRSVHVLTRSALLVVDLAGVVKK
jgi:hypothetical protein